MKQLATEQLKEIEAILIQKYELTYADVREEVLDHIACEIETIMDEGNASFVEAFRLVLSKWHRDLKPSSFVGFKRVPSFIAKRLIRSDLRFQSLAILGLLLLFILLYGVGISAMIPSFAFLLLSWAWSFIVLFQTKKEYSHSICYYKEQLKHLSFLNAFTLLLVIGAYSWFWFNATFPIGYVEPVISYIAALSATYTFYFSYRLHQFGSENRIHIKEY